MKQICLAWILMNHLWLACIGDPWVGKEPGKFLVCEGNNATFLWNFSGSEVKITQITWFFNSSNMLTYTSGSEYAGAKYAGRVKYISTVGNAALLLRAVSKADAGKYGVSMTTDTLGYQSENAELVVINDTETCFATFTMSINQQMVSTSNDEITRTVTSGDSLKIEMHIPDGCNNEAVCEYKGSECGRCHLNTTCVFEVENVQPGNTVAMTVIPCQGVVHSYSIKLLGGKTPLSTGAKAGIGAAVAAISVIVIISVISVLKKKQTRH